MKEYGKYGKALNISGDIAVQLAKETKGYAFEFQALGMVYYDNEKKLRRGELYGSDLQ